MRTSSSLAVLALFLWTGLSVAATNAQQTEPPPPPPAAPKKIIRIRQGGNITAKMVLHKVQPKYPEEARENGIEGTVRLHAIIARDGSIAQLELVSGHPVLAKSALEAVRQWLYKPTLLNGEPVEVDTTIDVIFSLSR
jgi:TonB family protein